MTALDAQNGPDEQTRVASWRLLLSSPVTLVSALVLVAVVVIALFAHWLTPYGINDIDVPDALRAPAARTGSAPTSWAATCCPACSSRSKRPCGSRWSAWRSRWSSA